MEFKRKTKAWIARIMAIVMVFCVPTQMELTVSAEEAGQNSENAQDLGNDTLDFSDENAVYAIVADSGNGKAINIKGVGWQAEAAIDGTYNKESNMLTEETAQFKIAPLDNQSGADKDEVKVKITCYYDDKWYQLRTESGQEYIWADDREDDNNTYIIKKTGENIGVIQSAVKEGKDENAGKKQFLVLKENKGKIGYDNVTASVTAEKFYFVKNPTILNTECTIEHKKSGKYIKSYAKPENDDKGTWQCLTVDGNKDDKDTVFKKAAFSTNTSDVIGTVPVVGFVSKEYGSGIVSAWWKEGAVADYVRTGKEEVGGWESMQVVPNGDGTVSFKDSYYGDYITVDDQNHLKCGYKGELTENEKFYIHTMVPPAAVEDLAIEESTRTQETLDLSWSIPECIYNHLQLWMKGSGDLDFKAMDVDLSGKTSYQVTGLQPGSEYSFKLLIKYIDEGSGADSTIKYDKTYGNEATAKTRAGAKPATPTNLHIKEQTDGNFRITWDAAEHATKYEVWYAPSMLSGYEKADETDQTSIEIAPKDTADKYGNYYKIIAINGDERSEKSECISLEIEMFGSHTLIFSPKDDVDKISAILDEVFEGANDYYNDAQFNGEQWQVYFKKGDYTKMACLYLGFYTSFNGLGKVPTDVKLNNIAIPAYLPGGALGAGEDNATCNFWRSAENLSVIDTGNEQGKAGYDAAGKGRQDYFNWAVAQAAPLRRVYTTRKIAYDWKYGWASGGYVADCFIDNAADDAAGTWPGQQFYTRNTKVAGGIFGAQLNNFFQGVEAGNQLTAETGERMYKDIGYTNWGIASSDGTQQVSTQIDSTEKISEKPFLYLDDNNEYQVFVPAIRENVRGISWGDGKANGGMGEGKSIPLDEFYLASPEDSAAKINEQIKAGKNIYFTPGIYHAEIPIEVNRENVILLGSGMASIIPDNGDMAMHVADLDGIRIEGLIFDAGLSSKYLLQVGTKGVHKSHADNPIILQDLFFRVGGTTDVLTKSDDALEINSDDVIGDHFWIWRADHGAGVEWYGNESKHGLIVNGDNVTCYALFNEHFQEYNTLWNGENGKTFFYQNETCYDPISQEAWMSHEGTVNGYSSYKVSNDVDSHYAVGLGIYCVFIYTGL